MKFFTNHFGLEKCFPDSKVVELSDGRKVSVPVYDFAAQLRSLVQNEDLFNDQNMIEDYFDPQTMRPTKAYEDFGPDDTVGDLTTGRLFHEGMKLYCNRSVPRDCDAVMGFPLVLFTDGAVHDNNGGLEVKPVSFTGGMLKEEVRAKRSSYKHLGFVPSLLIGKGENADCFDDE